MSIQDKAFVFDTNILLDNIESVTREHKVVLLSHTLRELEKHKISKNGELAYKARRATRFIKNNMDEFIFDTKNYDGSELGEDYTSHYEDDNILKACVDNDYGLATNDVLLEVKARGLGLEVIDGFEREDESRDYKGVKDLYLDLSLKEDKELLARIYENLDDNFLKLYVNEYLAIWDETKPEYSKITGELIGYENIDTFKFNGEKLVKLKYQNVRDIHMGVTKPLNVKQKMLFDMLQNKNIGVALTTGRAGSGKDHCMMAHAINEVTTKGRYTKIVFIRNIVPLKDAGQTGYLTGDLDEKMNGWMSPVIDALGGQQPYEALKTTGQIEVQHFESIRGRSYTNTIVYAMEIQNMSREHARMLLSRIGEGSILIANGDITQVDNDSMNSDNAITALKSLRGNELFAMVELDKTERSDIASLAELIE